MPYEAFRLNVANRAQEIDFNALDSSIKSSLFRYTTFNNEIHDLFMFLVSPYEILGERELTWREKRKSYNKVDRVLIHLNFPSEGMELLGIHPEAVDSHQQRELDLSGELLFEVGIPKILKFKVTSKFQNKIRSDRFGLYSYRTNNSAQWVFLKHWVKSGNPFEMSVLCQVPRNLPRDDRHLYCDAQANQKGRVITGTYGALVSF